MFILVINKSLGREIIIQHIRLFGITIGLFTVKYESWYIDFVFDQIKKAYLFYVFQKSLEFKFYVDKSRSNLS